MERPVRHQLVRAGRGNALNLRHDAEAQAPATSGFPQNGVGSGVRSSAISVTFWLHFTEIGQNVIVLPLAA